MATSRKKDQNPAEPAPSFDAEEDDASARNVWLAGLGAFAKAQAEGSKVFESLVNEGMAIQRKTQALAEDRMAEASKRMAEMTARAGGGGLPWGRLEGIFEERVARALERLGTPAAQDLLELKERIERLENLAKSPADAAATTASTDVKRRAATAKQAR